MIRLFCLFIFAGIAVQSEASEYSIIVTAIPRPVTINFPDEFQMAETQLERQRRQRLLNFYHLNPAIRGSYDEILLPDWSSQSTLPHIIVGILGTTKSRQGQFDVEEWQEIRQMFIDANKRSITEIREKYVPQIDANSPVSIKTTDVWVSIEEQIDPNFVVILSLVHKEVEGNLQTILSARKINYHNGYIICVDVSVDAIRPDALETLNEYLAVLTIESI